MKDNDTEIDAAQTPKRFDGHPADLEKIRKTFTNCIPNKTRTYFVIIASDMFD